MSPPSARTASFLAAEKVLGWDRVSLAARFGVDEKQVRRWASGSDVPEPVLEWMLDLVAWLSSNPPPRRPFERN